MCFSPYLLVEESGEAGKMTSAEIMEFSKASPFDWENPMKKENQKLFPFYFLTNFHCRVQDVNDPMNYIDVPDLFCDYCGENVTEGGYGSYFTAYVVIDGSGTLKNICRPLWCLNKPNNLMPFSHQRYGFKEPLKFPEIFNASNEHKLVFKKLCTDWRGYWLKAFSKGISLKDYDNELKESYHGGNVCFDGWDGWFEHNSFGMKLMDNNYKVVFKLSIPRIIQIINEIILNQNQEQLALW